MKKQSILLFLFLAHITSSYSAWYSKTEIMGNFSDVADTQFNNSKIIAVTPTQVSTWDIESGKKIHSFENNFLDTSAMINSYLGNKDELFIVAENCQRKLLNTQTGKILWQEPADSEMPSGMASFNSDGSKILMQWTHKGVLIDAESGKVKTILWNDLERSCKNQAFAQFLPQSSDIVVIHSGWLDGAHNNGVEYKHLIPDDVHCALFSSASKKLVYCGPWRGDRTIMIDDLLSSWSGKKYNISQQKYNNSQQEDSLDAYNSFYSHVVDMESGKKFSIKGRDYTLLMGVSLQDDGKVLLCSSYSPYEKGNYKDHYCYVDLFNVEESTELPTLAIPCDSQPLHKVVVSSKNLLLLGMRKKCQLWDTAAKILLHSFDMMSEWPTSVNMNADCNQIVIVEDDRAVVWQKQDKALVSMHQASSIKNVNQVKYNNFSSLSCLKALLSFYETLCCGCCSQ